MIDLETLSTRIDDALSALPADAEPSSRLGTIAGLIDSHIKTTTRGIASERDFGAFLRACGFAKGAVRHLAPAFKAVVDAPPTGTLSSETIKAALAELREVAASFKNGA